MSGDIEGINQTNVTLPCDNRIKDFLISANDKFAEYRQIRPDAYCILTIVYDNFINEPISILSSQRAGLLTEQSFYRNEAGRPVGFPNIDGIVVCRYLHQFSLLLKEAPLEEEVYPFRYHHRGYPFKAFIQNPHGNTVPEKIIEALNALPYHLILGPEYDAQGECVLWI